MKFIKQAITSFYSTNLTDDFDDYDSSKVYTLETDETALTNDSVCKYGNYYYRSLVDNNAGNIPTEHINKKWVKWGVSNKYAMIDLKSTSSSKKDDDIVVEFTKGAIDSIAIGYFQSELIILEHIASDGTVLSEYTKYYHFSFNDNVVDYYSFTYSEYTDSVKRAVYIPIINVGNRLRVTITKSSTTNSANVGFLVGGEGKFMGKSLYGVSFGFNSFSVKNTDEFGSFDIIKRGVQETVDFETIIDTTSSQFVKMDVKKIYDDVVAFIVDESADSKLDNIVTFGTIENLSIAVQNPTKTTLSWSVVESI